MKKYFMIMFTIFILLSSPVNSWAISTTEFYKDCVELEKNLKTKKVTKCGSGYLCWGLINGVMNTASAYSLLLPQGRDLKICFPDKLSSEAQLKTVMDYLRKHPERWKFKGAFLIIEAFYEAYPCQ